MLFTLLDSFIRVNVIAFINMAPQALITQLVKAVLTVDKSTPGTDPNASIYLHTVPVYRTVLRRLVLVALVVIINLLMACYHYTLCFTIFFI